MTTSEWLNRSLLFKLSYIILAVLAFKLYLDKTRLENELDTRASIASNLGNSPKSALSVDEHSLVIDIKKNLNNLNLNIGKTNENLQKYADISNKINAIAAKLDGVQQEKPQATQLQQQIQDAVKVYDLNAPLEPAELFNSIQCKKSRELYSITTTLCVHDLNKDVHVSGSIWRDGIWELHIMKVYMDYINKNPDWMVMDIGAQVGQYSLYPASAGRNVLTVEPFYDNIVRIHKASKTANTQGNIKLLANAISNKRGEIKQLQPNSDNIGGQSLLQNKNKVITKGDINPKDPNAKYYVETILFDDLVPYLPFKSDGKKYEKAIMKIDIEGFEPYAFQNANKLFDTIDIPIIFMEWGNLPGQTDMKNEIEGMISFLMTRNYKAYGDGGVVLNRNSWSFGWPWDIVWKKEGY